jgi:hypothetical protein
MQFLTIIGLLEYGCRRNDYSDELKKIQDAKLVKIKQNLQIIKGTLENTSKNGRTTAKRSREEPEISNNMEPIKFPNKRNPGLVVYSSPASVDEHGESMSLDCESVGESSVSLDLKEPALEKQNRGNTNGKKVKSNGNPVLRVSTRLNTQKQCRK